MIENEPAYSKSADYYDILYKWKDYQKEATDFLSLSQEILGRPLTSLLDLGCGTGNHARIFAQQGISIVGVDLSEEEIKIAQKKFDDEGLSAEFVVNNMIDVQLELQFDAAAVFFGGFGYLLTDMEVIQFLNNLHRLVKPDGFLFFEFWHTLGIKPNTSHYNIAKEEKTQIIRVNTTQFDIMTGIATMPMKHFVFHDKILTDEFTETHQIRTYTIPQLKSLVQQSPWKSSHIIGNYSEYKEERKPKWDDFRLFAILIRK
ncbi:MAG: class I SAM-dependent DNA methyltransferase [Candidatus Hodarchaeota archaeon]